MKNWGFVFLTAILSVLPNFLFAQYDTLYYVCDGGDELYKIHRGDGGTVRIGDVGAPDIETVAFWPGTDSLYACDAGDFGTIFYSPATMPASNLFNFIAEIDAGGTADGSDGPQALDDVDGLSFDPWTGILWASNRRFGDHDLLFQIDPTTGQFVPDAFGAGIDYVIIDDEGVYLDIDDIAISPIDGRMYTVATQWGAAQVLEINKYTGEVSSVVPADRPDVEGLAYHNDGTFWGTVGTDTEFWQIDPETGTMSNMVDIRTAACTDPESVAALVAAINTYSGTVWNDADYDGVLDGGETGVNGVTINLFYDSDSSGTLSSGDILIQSTTTDVNGDYEFLFAARAHLISSVSISSLPAGFAFTTDNIEVAEFDGFGQTELNNNFGIATGPDCDNDGIPNFAEGGSDFDLDAVADSCDLDSDNDGILDAVEFIYDSDYDGQMDFQDKDSDNDGIPDAIEANSGLQPTGFVQTFGWLSGTDTDGDGLLDVVDAAPAVAYGGGSTSTLANPDTDGDGVRDTRDRDSDNDGILDVTEAGGTDVNGDGEIDGFGDLDNDGYFDGANFNYLPIYNTDSTSEADNGLTLLPDYIDRDSDYDGVLDSREGFSTTGYPARTILNDTDNDGVLDIYDFDFGGNAAPPYDIDNDGVPDYRDGDADGDGEADIIEGNDADFNGVSDATPGFTDTDNDGLDDIWDNDPAVWGGTSNVVLQNEDADQEPDWRDLDDPDNPGILFYVCDGTNTLHNLNRYTQTAGLIGGTGAVTITAIAYDNFVDTLFAVGGTDMGWLRTTTGAYTAYGRVDGTSCINGSQGCKLIKNIRGLVVDPWTTDIWALEGEIGQDDKVFKIDRTTHQVVLDAFGAGVDYLVLDQPNYIDTIEGIAINPLTHDFYLVGTASDNQTRLMQFNSNSGAIIDSIKLQQGPIYSIAFHNDGTLFGTENTPQNVWEIELNGAMTQRTDIAASCTGADGIAANVAPRNEITGTLWDDADMDQVIDGGESGVSGVTVQLYYDLDNDGVVDPSDILLQSDTTDVNGDYTFYFGTVGNLVLRIDATTLPTGYSFTTDNVEEADFVDQINFGEADSLNHFGISTGTDCDGDGIPDFAEGGAAVDFDGDGIDNMCDLDSDNDGILDSEEGEVDSDGDGQADYLDLDSDNDGIPDALEANSGAAISAYDASTGNLVGTDGDGDGLIDDVDNDPAVAYGVGSTSALANPDHDGDGLADSVDKDSDNDGITDIIEAGGTDSDGDGAVDSFADSDNDGYHDVLTSTPWSIPNVDGSTYEVPNGLGSLPDYIDWDSDGDGLSDQLEGQTTAAYQTPGGSTDSDGDGILDFWDTDSGNSPIDPHDTDNDGTPDYQDNDSDNDTIIDLIEGNDANGDGVADSNAFGTDTDGDGMDNNFDLTSGSYGGGSSTPHQDSDGDGEDDWRDTDDDDDGVLTVNEPSDSNPANGTPDYLETNPCGPGFVLTNITTGYVDTVTNDWGVGNELRIIGAPDASTASISTNDSCTVRLQDTVSAGETLQLRLYASTGTSQLAIRVSEDSSTWSTNSGAKYDTIFVSGGSPAIDYPYTVPANTFHIHLAWLTGTNRLDAISYSYGDCLADKDYDGIENAVDVDDDNDGLLDVTEGAVDTDGDGVTDDCDLDSDNDGIPDAVEANGGVLPANMNAQGQFTVAYMLANDADNDGWGSSVDPSEGGTVLADTDTDGDLLGLPDRLDLDSDNDCLPDAMEANSGSLPSNMDGNGQYPTAYATANDADGDGLMDDLDSDNGGSALANPDTDGDGAANYIDVDADGDGLSDFLESYDPDIVPAGTDGDGDGIDDSSDPDAGGTLPNFPDDDCNGIIDYLDAAITTANSGPWKNTNTWTGGVVPSTSASVYISAGHTVTLTQNTTAGSIEIDAAGALDIGVYTLTMNGSFTVNGTFAPAQGTVNFAGTSCAQSVCGGTITFPGMLINNCDGVNVTCGDVIITDSVSLCCGTLDVSTANSFCLQSDATGTAGINSCGTGTITGDVTIKQYKAGCAEGYFGLASPIKLPYSVWSDDVLLYGFTNAPYEYDPSNTYWYDESIAGTLENGFAEPSSYNDSIVRGRGYYVYTGLSSFPLTIDVTGSVSLDPFVFPLQQTDNSVPAADGYNLLGNPYPSTIVWDMTSGGWTNVGCCDAIFIYDDCNDQYESYVDGIGTNGGDGVIEAFQAFWMKAHLPGASLTVNRTALATDAGNFNNLQQHPQVFRLEFVAPDGSSDEAIIRLHPLADEEMDLPYDAGKLFSLGDYVREIYTEIGPASDPMAMSINALPDNQTDRTIKVRLRAPDTDQYTLRLKGINTFPDDVCIVVEDLVTGTIIDPKVTTEYDFNLTGSITSFDNRFNVIFTYPIEASSTDASCFNGVDGTATVTHPGTGPFEYIWTDVDGHVVASSTSSSNTNTVTGLEPGTYTATVIDQGATYCSTQSVDIVIAQPAMHLQASTSFTAASCDGSADGAINLNIIGGAQPYSYQWNNGATTQDLQGIAAGTYDVVITDANGCQSTTSVILNAGQAVEAVFQANSDTINLWYGEYLQLTNMTVGANSFVWEFGDGTSFSIAQDPIHYFDTVGTYTVRLTAMSGACNDAAEMNIVVIDDPTAQTGTPSVSVANEQVEVFEYNSQLYMRFRFEGNEEVQLSLYNSVGQIIDVRQLNVYGTANEQLPLNDLAAGAYLVRLRTNEREWVTKITIE